MSTRPRRVVAGMQPVPNFDGGQSGLGSGGRSLSEMIAAHVVSIDCHDRRGHATATLRVT
jgi:hypothetical protein